MHLPDGFLTANTWVPAWIIAVGGLGYCFKKASVVLKDKMIPLMGVMSAFIFAAQMLNFPIAAGTSGHLLGGVLAAVLLGPYIAAIVIACVLLAQCLIFQDGGLTALGANIVNMSFAATIAGYLAYAFIKKILGEKKGFFIAVAFASWVSVVLAASFCAIELALSKTVPLGITLPAMTSVHALIGIGEAIITCLVLSFIIKVRPDLIYKRESNL